MLRYLASSFDPRARLLAGVACLLPVLVACAPNVDSSGDGGASPERSTGQGASGAAGGSDVGSGPCETTTAPTVAWKRVASSTRADAIFGLTLDPHANLVVVGDGGAALDFGCSPMGHHEDGAFLAKLGGSGDCVFSKRFGVEPTVLFAVATDADGAIYVTGLTEPTVTGSIDLGCGAMPAQGSNVFIAASYSPDGVCRWSKVLNDPTPPGADSRGIGVVVDAAKNSYLLAIVRGETTICGQTYKNDSNKYIEGTGVLTKLDADGNCVFSHGYGPRVVPSGIGIDSSDAVTVVGTYAGSVDFGGGALAVPRASQAPFGFVAKFTSSGEHVFSKSTHGITQAMTVAVDPSGDIVVGGAHAKAIDFGKAPITTTAPESGFVARLDAKGDQVFLKGTGGNDENAVGAVGLDCAGNTIIASSEGLDPAPIHFQKLDPSGSLVWQTHFTGLGPRAIELAVRGDEITVGGALEWKGDFGVPVRAHGEAQDALVFRLTP